MTEFHHKPVKSVTINNLLQRNMAQFIQDMRQLNYNGHVKYLAGILFRFYTSVDTDKVVDDELNGIYYWTTVIFTKMEKYKSELKIDGDHIKIQVMDESQNPLFQDFAKWLKSQPVWSGKNG